MDKFIEPLHWRKPSIQACLPDSEQDWMIISAEGVSKLIWTEVARWGNGELDKNVLGENKGKFFP